MNVFSKLNTLLRAGVRESAEAIANANAIRIYQQEIVDAEQLLIHRRETLAKMIAGRKTLEEDIERTREGIARRETQLSRIPEGQRSEALLDMAARDIAKTEAMLHQYEQGHQRLCERIGKEEITLRNLLREIKDHRREIKLLETETQRQKLSPTSGQTQTVPGRLAALRATRSAIGESLAGGAYAEDSMEEAIDRVETTDLDRQLEQDGHTDEAHHVAMVLARLKTRFATP